MRPAPAKNSVVNLPAINRKRPVAASHQPISDLLSEPGLYLVPNHALLLEFHLGASFFQLLLNVFGIFLSNAFFDSRRHAFHQVFGFFQA